MKNFEVKLPGGRTFIYKAKSEASLKRRFGKQTLALGIKIKEVK